MTSPYTQPSQAWIESQESALNPGTQPSWIPGTQYSLQKLGIYMIFSVDGSILMSDLFYYVNCMGS